jgi:hypothetical protein
LEGHAGVGGTDFGGRGFPSFPPSCGDDNCPDPFPIPHGQCIRGQCTFAAGSPQAQKKSFWEKVLSVFYVKASVGAALEVGLEEHAGKAKTPYKVGIKVGGDVKSTMTMTTDGVSVSATKEAQAGLNVGKNIVGPQTSTENVTVKNGEVLANHEVEKSSSWLFGAEKAEGTVSKGAAGYGFEVDAGIIVVGFEVGIDTDKLMELAAPDK